LVLEHHIVRARHFAGWRHTLWITVSNCIYVRFVAAGVSISGNSLLLSALGQVEGWTPPKAIVPNEVEIRTHVEAFIAATRADIRHGGDRAFYDMRDDYIAVPHPEQFMATETSSATECFYSVILHELTHWTGAAHRLARALRARFGDGAYAMEELIAEFGAAFLCADLHIANEPRLDHACYVSSWLDVLNRDRTALFTAANKASAAIGYLEFVTRSATAGVPK